MQLATSFTKDLVYPLSPGEIEERKTVLARVVEEIAEVDAEKGKVVKSFGDRLKALRERSLDLAHTINQGEEKRPVLCSERAEMRNFQVLTYRHDSGSIVDTRAMTPDEVEEARQGGLFADNGGVRVASIKPGLNLATPPAASNDDATSPPAADAAADGDVDGAITNPSGLLDGTQAKKAKRTRKNKNAEIAPPTPTDTVGVAAIVRDPEPEDEDLGHDGDIDDDAAEPGDEDDGG